MKKVILMAAASLAIFATSFAQNTATTPAEAPKMGKKSRVKPVGDAPAMQGTPTPATQTQGTPAGESRKGRGEGEARSESKGRGEGEARGEGKGMGQGGKKVLGLSAEQETKFKAINEGHKAAVKTVQTDASLAADAKKAQIDLLKSKYESDVQTLLTTDQFAKWKEMRAKRDEKGDRKEGGDHRDGGDHKGGDHKDGGDMKKAPAPANGGAAPTAPADMKMKDKKSKKNN